MPIKQFSLSHSQDFRVPGLILGIVLAAIFPHSAAATGQTAVQLGTASPFAILAGSEITSVPTSAITGNVGLSPAARSDITGLTAAEVTGTIYASDDSSAVAVMLSQAKGDLGVAYNDAAGRTGGAVDVSNADLGGLTLAPGLYNSSGTLALTGNLTLDAGGNANAVFIFQIASSLTVAPGSQVILSGGANSANIFWQTGTSAALKTTVIFEGNILAAQSVTIATGATLNGRALAMSGAVTLEANTINLPSLQPVPAGFGPVSLAANGSVTLVITNTPNTVLTLQTSTDLINWTTLTTVTPTLSPYMFTDTAATGRAARFYRAFYP
jgi:hypothetical protein